MSLSAFASSALEPLLPGFMLLVSASNSSKRATFALSLSIVKRPFKEISSLADSSILFKILSVRAGLFLSS